MSQGMTHITGPYIIPGFVDIHNHGMGGAPEVVRFWTNPDHSCRLLARHGTTSVVATILFPTEDVSLSHQLIHSLDALCGRYRPGLAVLEGIHGEGPIVADPGALPESDSDMPFHKFKELVDSIRSLKVMTISPSKDAPGDFQRLRYLASKGITPSLGNDRSCTAEQITGALRAAGGCRPHITHLFNVTSFHHRGNSLTNFGLVSEFPQEPEFEGLTPPTIELIGDANHISTLTAQCAFSARPPTDVALITDCMGDCTAWGTEFSCNKRPVRIDDAGAAVYVGTKTLVGSTATLWAVFQNAIHRNQIPLYDAVLMTSTTPAKIARLDHVGSIEVGKKANLVIVSEDLRNLQAVYIHGNEIEIARGFAVSH